ncbi:MAG: FkbM family methyltransferase [Ahrensia sp.]
MTVPGSRRTTRAAAVKRSIDVYYRDTARTARMDDFNRQFISEGSLAFDIGAHVGDRTGSFVRLGARVVTVEPQPQIFRALRLLYGHCDRVSLEQTGVGRQIGTLQLHVNSANPTVTTASEEMIENSKIAEAWQGQVWDQTILVPVTTLDKLIDQHGLPDFTKIDVEGHELAVLEGLSQPLPALSFEFTTIQRPVALACLDRLGALGTYEFNVSLGEAHVLRYDSWIDAKAMAATLEALPMAANSGDVFARLTRP